MKPLTRKTLFVAALTAATLASAVACSGERPTLVADPSSPTTGPNDTVATPIVPARGGLKAIVSPTGIILAVKGQAGDKYVVETPCGNEAQLSWGQPIKTVQVVLDPGHGGDEKGAQAELGGTAVTEAEINLRVARRVAALLGDSDISAIMTRGSDYRIGVKQRANLAEVVEAQAFVSIHHNSVVTRDSDKPGAEIYVQKDVDDSRRLGGLIYEEVIAGLTPFDIAWKGLDDAGVLVVQNSEGEDSYGIVRHPQVPTVLAELGYIDNPAELEVMVTDEYVEAAALAISTGIQRYLTTQEPGSGFVEAGRKYDPAASTGGTSDCVEPVLE